MISILQVHKFSFQDKSTPVMSYTNEDFIYQVSSMESFRKDRKLSKVRAGTGDKQDNTNTWWSRNMLCPVILILVKYFKWHILISTTHIILNTLYLVLNIIILFIYTYSWTASYAKRGTVVSRTVFFGTISMTFPVALYQEGFILCCR